MPEAALAAPPVPGRAAPFVRFSAALHVGAFGLLLADPRAWPLVVATIIPDHLALAWGSLRPRSPLVGPNLTRLPAGAAPGQVALTFDDGPDPVTTPRVLDRLEAAGARASFFCVGRKAERHPDLVSEIARRGHRVENHSFGHSNVFCLFTPGALARDLDRAQDVLTRLAGRAPRYFRAPAGLRSPWLDGVLRDRGLTLVSWTRRGLDTVARSSGSVAARLARGLAEGDILVLHDGGHGASPGPPRSIGLEALPRVLESVRAAGLRAVPLPSPGGTIPRRDVAPAPSAGSQERTVVR
jgi:peptidoglycan/xylan/chitin deacetylase (PgdA/CDA1 family)